MMTVSVASLLMQAMDASGAPGTMGGDRHGVDRNAQLGGPAARPETAPLRGLWSAGLRRVMSLPGWVAARAERRARESTLVRLRELSPHLINDIGFAELFDDIPAPRRIVLPKQKAEAVMLEFPVAPAPVAVPRELERVA